MPGHEVYEWNSKADESPTRVVRTPYIGSAPACRWEELQEESSTDHLVNKIYKPRGK